MVTLALILISISGVYEVAPSHWRAFQFRAEDPGHVISGSYEAAAESANVQVLILREAQLERFAEGRSVRPVYVSGFNDSSRFRTRLQDAGEYVLVLDNRLGGRRPARVALNFHTIAPRVLPVRTLPDSKRRAVVAMSLGFLGAVTVLAGALFLRAANRTR